MHKPLNINESETTGRSTGGGSLPERSFPTLMSESGMGLKVFFIFDL